MKDILLGEDKIFLNNKELVKEINEKISMLITTAKILGHDVIFQHWSTLDEVDLNVYNDNSKGIVLTLSFGYTKNIKTSDKMLEFFKLYRSYEDSFVEITYVNEVNDIKLDPMIKAYELL